MANRSSNNANTAGALPVTTDNDAAKESLIGTERRGRPANVSWGSIIAGVVTFLAVTVLLSLVTAGIGLGGSGVGAGIWSVIALALALAAAGFVAGALAVRSGLLHGFLTWATSLVVALALTVWLSASLLGAVGGVVSSASQALSGTDVSQVVEDVQGNVDEEEAQDQADEALEDAEQTAEDAADTAQASSWWGFVGLLLGAVIASLGGVLGVRTVVNRDRDDEAVTVRTTR
jgi:surface antigen